jgi:hypothetical protein
LTALFYKRKICLCTDDLHMEIKSKPSDDWLWRFSKGHGSACRCTFGEGLGAPAEELSPCEKSCLGWGQGASLL